MAIDTDRGAIGRLTSGQRAGYFEIPEELLDALDFERRVAESSQSAVMAASVSPERAVQIVADTVLETLRQGKPTPKQLADKILEAELEQRRAAYLADVFQTARNRAREG